MDHRFVESGEAYDIIEGAVISHHDVVDGWTRLFLKDGRVIAFPDCEYFCVLYSKGLLQ